MDHKVFVGLDGNHKNYSSYPANVATPDCTQSKALTLHFLAHRRVARPLSHDAVDHLVPELGVAEFLVDQRLLEAQLRRDGDRQRGQDDDGRGAQQHRAQRTQCRSGGGTFEIGGGERRRGRLLYARQRVRAGLPGTLSNCLGVLTSQIHELLPQRHLR